MNKIIKTLIVLLTVNTSIMAQKGFEIQKEMLINVSAEKLWEMVGPGFVDVHVWSSNVDHAEGVGEGQFDGAVCSERVCNVNVKGFSSLNEKLTKYDADGMTLAYEVNDGLPKFVIKAVNDWTVIAVSQNQSKLVMKGEFRSKGLMAILLNGMMEKQFTQTLDTVLEDAKIYAETGIVSVKKQKRMAELAKKRA